jgi:hypothetical protein
MFDYTQNVWEELGLLSGFVSERDKVQLSNIYHTYFYLIYGDNQEMINHIHHINIHSYDLAIIYRIYSNLNDKRKFNIFEVYNCICNCGSDLDKINNLPSTPTQPFVDHELMLVSAYSQEFVEEKNNTAL